MQFIRQFSEPAEDHFGVEMCELLLKEDLDEGTEYVPTARDPTPPPFNIPSNIPTDQPSDIPSDISADFEAAKESDIVNQTECLLPSNDENEPPQLADEPTKSKVGFACFYRS